MKPVWSARQQPGEEALTKKTGIVAAAALALALGGGPALAGGDEHDSLASGGHASYGHASYRGSSGGGSSFGSWYTRETSRSIGRMEQGGDARPRSGGVGDMTGHTAFMNGRG